MVMMTTFVRTKKSRNFALPEDDDGPYDDDNGDNGGHMNSKININKRFFFLVYSFANPSVIPTSILIIMQLAIACPCGLLRHSCYYNNTINNNDSYYHCQEAINAAG